MKDWLGQDYDVGDWILYAKSYGGNHSCQMLIGEVVRITNTRVIVSVLKRSRSDYQYTVLVDKRTGKQIRGGKLHIKKEAHYRNKVTGQEIQNMYTLGIAWNDPSRNDWEYVRETYWDYVEKVPATTVLQITDNILKVDKETYRDTVALSNTDK